MSSPERSDMEAYQDVLQEMAERLEVADGFLAGVGTKFDLESAALQLRLVSELMVLGSLITNREAISCVSSVLKLQDEPNKTRAAARKANPDYWPRAVEHRHEKDREFSITPATETVINEADWGPEFGFVSELLHAHLPQRPPRDLQADAERLQGLSTRIKALLKVHVIVLVGAQHAFVGRVDMDKREVEVAILQRYPEES